MIRFLVAWCLLCGSVFADYRVSLPEVPRPSLVLFVDDATDPVVKAFATHAGLKAVKGECYSFLIESGSDIYKYRYADDVQALPCVRLQCGSTCLYEAAGRIPAPDVLAKQLQQRCKPGECNPKREPVRPWKPEDLKPPVVYVPPDATSFNWRPVALIVAGLVGLGVALYVTLQKESKE